MNLNDGIVTKIHVVNLSGFKVPLFFFISID